MLINYTETPYYRYEILLESNENKPMFQQVITIITKMLQLLKWWRIYNTMITGQRIKYAKMIFLNKLNYRNRKFKRNNKYKIRERKF